MVPVVILDHLTPTQRRALVIADNRIAENAGWDEAMLQVELAALQDDNFDLSLTGFDADALADLLAGEETTTEGDTDEDAVPEDSGTVDLAGRVMSGSAVSTACSAVTRRTPMPTCATGRRDCRHGVHRSTLQRQLRQLGQGQNARQGSRDPERQPRRRILRLPAGGTDAHVAHCRGGIYVAMSSSELDACRQRSVRPEATGRPLSSGPRTPSHWGVRTISVSTSRSSTAGPRMPIVTGAATATRATSGRSRSRRRTICTRP
jgi:hypothetical protein